MRILITDGMNFYGGGERFVLELATGLKSRGHEVVVASEPGQLLGKKAVERGLDAVSLVFRRGLGAAITILELRRIIRERRIDLLHSNAVHDRSAGGFAARLTRIPHVASVHSQRSIQFNPLHWVRNRFAVDRFLVDGDATRDLLVRLDRVAAAKISVIRIGLDAPKIADPIAARTRTRAAIGIPAGALVVGNVARAVPFKATDRLVEAAGTIVAKHPDVHFMFVGDGILKASLEAQAKALGLGGGAHFLGFRDDLDQLYPAMDLYAQPSIDTGGESFPLATVQALAAGLPIIVTDIGDMPSMLDGGTTGLLCKQGDAADLAAKLETLIESEPLRRKMGVAAKAFAAAHLTAVSMVEAVERVYRDLVPAAAADPSSREQVRSADA